MAGGCLGDGDKNILFLASFSMGHFNSLFLLLCVQILTSFFFLSGVMCPLGFPFISTLGLTRAFRVTKSWVLFVADRNYWGMSYDPVEILGWAGFWDMVCFPFCSRLFFLPFHLSLVIEIWLSFLVAPFFIFILSSISVSPCWSWGSGVGWGRAGPRRVCGKAYRADVRNWIRRWG